MVMNKEPKLLLKYKFNNFRPLDKLLVIGLDASIENDNMKISNSELTKVPILETN